MPGATPQFYSLVVFGVLSIVLLAGVLSPSRFPAPSYFRYLWVFFLFFNASEWISFTLAVWILALFSFHTLREYFSLVDIRLQDRWGILGAYLSIPFVMYLIQIDWYGLFIISIPVYAFLIVPFLVVLGGEEAKGTVFSIGAIDFGLFLFVYCIGHIGYLSLFSTWMAAFLIVAVALCDLVDYVLRDRIGSGLKSAVFKFLVAAPLTVAVSLLLSRWTAIPALHATMLGLLIPVLVLVGDFTISAIESDLGIARARLQPGRGQVIHGIKSYLFAAPVVFHYIRYFLR
jgi:phosphatidate cytidylyltransferase